MYGSELLQAAPVTKARTTALVSQNSLGENATRLVQHKWFEFLTVTPRHTIKEGSPGVVTRFQGLLVASLGGGSDPHV